MMDWNGYLENLLDSKHILQSLTFTTQDNPQNWKIPAIIRSSVLILDRLLKSGNKKNIFVFPEKSESLFLFVFAYLLHSIKHCANMVDYNPESFKPGDHLKYKNMVVEFIGTGTNNQNEASLVFKMADMDKVTAPLSILPRFQKTDLKRISKISVWDKIREDLVASTTAIDIEDKVLNDFLNLKAYIKRSISYASPVSKAKEQLSRYELKDTLVEEIFLIGQIDYKGDIKTIGPGKIIGVPAMLLSPDLFAVAETIKKKINPIDILFVDITSINMVINDLEALRYMLFQDMPIVCITDTANSFDLQILVDEGFKVWRWNKINIPEILYLNGFLDSDKKVNNCAKSDLNFIRVNCPQISESLKRLLKYRDLIEGQIEVIRTLYSKLISLANKALKRITPLTQVERKQQLDILLECDELLSHKLDSYISKAMIDDLAFSIDSLRSIIKEVVIFPKQKAIMDFLNVTAANRIKIVVEDSPYFQEQAQFWQQMYQCDGNNKQIFFINPTNYSNSKSIEGEITITICWLKWQKMYKILTSNITEKVYTFLYDIEDMWRSSGIRTIQSTLSNSSNRTIIREVLSAAGESIELPEEISEQITIPRIGQEEDVDIDTFILHGKYSSLAGINPQYQVQESVQAIPISFHGGFCTFIKPSHRLIVLSESFLSIVGRVSEKKVDKIKVGDLIVVRDSGKNIIREVADEILRNNNKEEYRNISTKWRRVFSQAESNMSFNQIYWKLNEADCFVHRLTLHNWMTDEDMIGPGNKENLIQIARAFDDEDLMRDVENIHEAIMCVRTAHQQAGMLLGKRLKEAIPKAATEFSENGGSIQNEPITIQLENIGQVRIFKILDISSPMDVNLGNVNRIIKEWGG